MTTGFSKNVKGEVEITIGTIPIDDSGFLQFTAPARTSPDTHLDHHRKNKRNLTLTKFKRFLLNLASTSSLPSYISIESRESEGKSLEIN